MGIFSRKKWYESTLHYVKHAYSNRLVEKNTAAVRGDALLESQYWGAKMWWSQVQGQPGLLNETDLINK